MPRSSGQDAPAFALYQEFYAVVRRIPRGRVATYGQIAELAGHPGAARAVGAAMRASSGRGLPWHRVIGKHARGLGKVAIHDPIGGTIQRGLLEKEGVRFTEAGHIRLDRHAWTPSDPPRRRVHRRRPPRRAGRGA